MRVGDKRHNLPQERFEYKVASPSNDLFSEKKHRRLYSGGAPSVVHRGIDSGGNAAAIQRIGLSKTHEPHSVSHQRENSAGLDMLSLAVDVSQDELAVAAGAHTKNTQLRELNHIQSGFYGKRPHTWMGKESNTFGFRKAFATERILSQEIHNYHEVAYKSGNSCTDENIYQKCYQNRTLKAPPWEEDHKVYNFWDHEQRQKQNDIVCDNKRLYPKNEAHPTMESRNDANSHYSLDYIRKGMHGHHLDQIQSHCEHSENQNDDRQQDNQRLKEVSHRAATMESRNDANSSHINFMPTSRNGDTYQKVGLIAQIFSSVSTSLSAAHEQTRHDISSRNEKEIRDNVQSSLPMKVSKVSGKNTVEELSTDSQPIGNIVSSASTSPKSAKRARRKCIAEGCKKRVVQGGRCISHGAKRKACAHEGCSKNVKKAGLCSTHGPARKRCEFESCKKVSVKGGRCISHGARKKLCRIEDCQKQATMSGMCKKHHDTQKPKTSSQQDNLSNIGLGECLQNSNNNNALANLCTYIRHSTKPEGDATEKGRHEEHDGKVPKSTHARGLSFFSEMNAVERIIGRDHHSSARHGFTRSPNGTANFHSRPRVPGSSPSQSRNGISQKDESEKMHTRGLSLFSDVNVADTIINNKIFM